VITPSAFLIAALGALQIAAIRSEPLPQMWTGGYTMKTQATQNRPEPVHANEWVSPHGWLRIRNRSPDLPAGGHQVKRQCTPLCIGSPQQRNVVQQSSADMSTSLLQTIASQNDQLLKYMSDPINRRAYMFTTSLPL
jgi:hypothetical protein